MLILKEFALREWDMMERLVKVWDSCDDNYSDETYDIVGVLPFDTTFSTMKTGGTVWSPKYYLKRDGGKTVSVRFAARHAGEENGTSCFTLLEFLLEHTRENNGKVLTADKTYKCARVDQGVSKKDENGVECHYANTAYMSQLSLIRELKDSFNKRNQPLSNDFTEFFDFADSFFENTNFIPGELGIM